MKELKRNSNGELIRIIAMSLIIFVHIIGHGIKIENFNKFIFFIYPSFLYGVNLFFLLSGYYKIKLKIKSLISLYFIILFYQIINIIICICLNVELNNLTLIKCLIFPISSNIYWFIAVYLLILITSPIINNGLEIISIKKLKFYIIFFFIIIIFSCWLGKNMCNPRGYTYINGLFLYCVGFFIHKYNFKTNKLNYLLIFFICLIFNNLLFYLTKSFMFTSYNSVFIIIGSISLFIYLIRLNLNNKYINKISTASLGCYLLQDGLFGNYFLYTYINKIFFFFPYSYLWIYFIMFILFWITSYILTKIEKNIFNTLIIKVSKFDNKIFKIIKNFLLYKI